MKKSRGWFAVVVAGVLAPAGLYFWPSDAATIVDEPRQIARYTRITAPIPGVIADIGQHFETVLTNPSNGPGRVA